MGYRQLQRDPDRPQLVVEALVDRAAQVLDPARAAGALPLADLARRHQRVVEAPALHRLVVVDEQLADLVADGAQRVVVVRRGRGRRARRSAPRGRPAAPRRRRTPCHSSALSRSISRNWRDWKPLAGASGSRNSRKPSGPIVSSTSSLASSSRSIATRRLSPGSAPPGRSRAQLGVDLRRARGSSA